MTTIAALDFKIHSLPRIDAFMKYYSRNDRSISQSVFNLRGPRKIIHVGMYSFGCPRVGNAAFAELFERNIKDGFRVVVDGDPVCAVPFSNAGFKHAGTEALIDPVGAGSIIIDSSFIERRLRNRTKSSVSVHVMSVYRKGLLGIKEASRRIKEMVDKDVKSNTKRDILALTLAVAPLLHLNAEGGVADPTSTSDNDENKDANIYESVEDTNKDNIEKGSGIRNGDHDVSVITRVTRMITGIKRDNLEKVLNEDTVVRRAYSMSGEHSISATSKVEVRNDHDHIIHEKESKIDVKSSSALVKEKVKNRNSDYARIGEHDLTSEGPNDMTASTDGTEFS